MSSNSLPGGTWTLGDLTVTRFGYGAMQFAGPWVMGPPADHAGALAARCTTTSKPSAWRRSTWSTSGSATPRDRSPVRSPRPSGRWSNFSGRA